MHRRVVVRPNTMHGWLSGHRRRRHRRLNSSSRSKLRETRPLVRRVVFDSIELALGTLWELLLRANSRGEVTACPRLAFIALASSASPSRLDHQRKGSRTSRAWLRQAWRVFLSKRTEADFQAWRDQRDWTERKYAIWQAGERLPSQKPSSLMKCRCGCQVFDSHLLVDICRSPKQERTCSRSQTGIGLLRRHLPWASMALRGVELSNA